MNMLMVGVSQKRTGGMWSVTKNLLENIQRSGNIEVKYIATSTNGSIFQRFKYMLIGIRNIKKELKMKKYDIVYVHMAEKGSVYRKGYVIHLARKTKCKVIIQMHAGPIMDWYKKRSIINKRIIKRIFNSADKFLVLGEYWKKEISEIVDSSKVEVLYNGISIPRVNSYNVNNKNILYMGRINVQKGIFDLIDAVDIIKDKIPNNVKFVICGEDETGKLKRYISDKSLTNYFVIKGWLVGDKVEEEYSKALINVLPSYVEGLSMNIIEAMAYGIPSITTDITTMPELIDRRCLYKPGDCLELSKLLEKFLGDKSLLLEESKKVYERAKNNFDINIIVSKLIKICNNIIDTN